MVSEVERRVAAVQATMARFANVAFVWGRIDCAKMVAFHLRQMGHHQGVGMHKAGSYRSALGARRALARAGYGSLSDALDVLGFARLAPAAALPGDIALLPGEDGFDAMCVVVGNGRVFGYHEDAVGAVVLQPARIESAWRV